MSAAFARFEFSIPLVLSAPPTPPALPTPDGGPTGVLDGRPVEIPDGGPTGTLAGRPAAMPAGGPILTPGGGPPAPGGAPRPNTGPAAIAQAAAANKTVRSFMQTSFRVYRNVPF